MEYADYHKLAVYQKSKELTKAIFSLWDSFPRTKPAEIAYNQLFRACTSISANIVEGYGRFSNNELKQFLKIARGSSFETGYWLESSQELLKVDTANLINLNTEIVKLLTTMINNLKN